MKIPTMLHRVFSLLVLLATALLSMQCEETRECECVLFEGGVSVQTVTITTSGTCEEYEQEAQEPNSNTEYQCVEI